MGKLDKLIEQLCPDGVRKLLLKDLEKKNIIELGRGKVISKTDLQQCPGAYPVFSSSIAGDGKFGEYGKYMFDDIRISWSVDGGGKFFYRDLPYYSLTNVSGWLKVLDENTLLTKYLYYVLIDEWGKKVFDYVKKAHPSIIREMYMIPLPPLPVQEEIVRILDNFTDLTAELTAELTARKKQYEYYREKLLTFKESDAKEA